MIIRATAITGVVLVAGIALSLQAGAADLPAIKATASNAALSCATPGRLMAFLTARNDKLDAKFQNIAVDYMRHGEELGMRWDYAFFQMLLETGNLKFGGDVKPSQNNFAGLGATGHGEHGESFPDVTTGVRAHLEHVLMYSGEKVSNPVAERTRKVQEWGVLTSWQKSIKGPVTFTQLARKWAPPARKYAVEIEQVAESFIDGACKQADPRPELVAMARSKGLKGAVVVAEAEPAPAPPAVEVAEVASQPEMTAGQELAKRANEEARAEGSAKRSGLGAGSAAKSAKTDDAKPQTFALLNPPKPEPDAPAAKAEQAPAVTKTAAGAAAKGAKAQSACKVFQASYGGAKSVIIKASANDVTQFTVLDVNEGSEAREAEAYIAAYAPGGKQVGEFKTQGQALDKAFELCPEG